MNVRNKVRIITAVVVLVASASSLLAAEATVLSYGFAKAEFFKGISGTAVDALLAADSYLANKPDETRFISGFDTPNGYGDNYGARVTGYIIPPTSGDYDFFLRSDDASQLFLSTSEKAPNPAADTPIAFETGCCKAFLEPGGDVTTVAPIALVGGKKYAFLAFVKEGGGGDFLQVAMRKVGDPTPAASLKPIGGKNLAVDVPANGATITISAQPANVTVTENRSATLKVVATASAPGSASLPITYQWQKNGVDIAGATASTFVTSRLIVADTGAKYAVALYTLGATNGSTTATVTVVTDTTPPVVVSAGSLQNGTATEVGVIFDEAVTAATATKLSNYTLGSGTVTAVRYVANSSGIDSLEQGVVLTVTGVTLGQANVVNVSGISDAKGNVMKTAVKVPFTASSFKWISIGRVADFKPDAIAVNTNEFNLISGGAAYWNTSDDITMVYEEISGDFDKKARIEYSDPSSNWARSGISARESLNKGAETTDVGGDNPASRYQMVIADPTTKFDGTLANNSYETNRRLNTGGATSSSAGGGTPAYPNAWLRLKRVGQLISMFRGDDGVNWTFLGKTDFGDPAVSDTPLPVKLFVGPTFGPENGNISDDAKKATWATRIREYGDASAPKPRGLATYTIGMNFGSDENSGILSPDEVAGVSYVAQGNWNKIPGQSGTVENLVAENNGKAEVSKVVVEFSSANLWASTGKGEENNRFTGADATLMTGYLDSAAATTSHATITGIPPALVSAGYDVYVYALGGVANGRGGAYRVVDAAGNVLKDYIRLQGIQNPTSFVEVPAGSKEYGIGNYVVFRGLKSASITVEATTADGLGVGAPPRAPINAIQITSAVQPPRDYSLALNFGTDQPSSSIASNVMAGVGFLAQANWNNLAGSKGTNVSKLVADLSGASVASTATVSWDSNNTWASAGIGEENNKFSGGDRTIFTGYLDTTASSTTAITIKGLPTNLTSKGYDAVIFMMGGVPNKGGGYRVRDAASGAVLKDYVLIGGVTNTSSYIKASATAPGSAANTGNYVVFSGLNAASIIIEASTAGGLGFGGSAFRAPINAVQLVSPASAAPPSNVKVTVARTGNSLSIGFSGVLQSADTITGPWADVAGAANPLVVTPTGTSKYYRSR